MLIDQKIYVPIPITQTFQYEETWRLYTVRKEIKCSGETEIIHELVHDTTQTS